MATPLFFLCFTVLFLAGVNVEETDAHNEYDNVEERYQKTKFEVQKFTAFQIGICTFHFSPGSKRYLARPFCFYVFPQSKITDQTMLFQVSKNLRKHCLNNSVCLVFFNSQIRLASWQETISTSISFSSKVCLLLALANLSKYWTSASIKPPKASHRSAATSVSPSLISALLMITWHGSKSGCTILFSAQS